MDIYSTICYSPEMEAVDQPRFPMRAVARRTALSPHVIRVWERRYGAVTPSRTGTNRRLYTENDVRRLSLLRDVTAQGHSIGLIAGLPTETLESMLEAVGAGPLTAAAPTERTAGAEESVAAIVQQCLRSVEQLDNRQLQFDLDRASTAFSLPQLLDGIIGPLMEQVGDLWRTGGLRPAHEHIATDVVRTFLAARRAAYTPVEGAPAIVVTTPTGQLHEIGALMVSLVARAEGWNDIYLGPNLPADDIAAAVVKCGAKALALSIACRSDDGRIENDLAFLSQQLPPGTRVFVGGRAADAYSDAIQRMGAKLFHSIAHFRESF